MIQSRFIKYIFEIRNSPSPLERGWGEEK